MKRPLWREDGSVVYNCCCLRQRNHSQVRVPQGSWPHFTVSDLRLPQPGGPGPCIYIPQEQGGPVIPPGTGLHSLLQIVLLITSRHVPHRKHRSTVAFVSVAGGTCLPSRWPKTGFVTPYMKNPLLQQLASFLDHYTAMDQPSQTRGPRAACGPHGHKVRPSNFRANWY
jgi:hypothetical protein